jgi:hypothetical protein
MLVPIGAWCRSAYQVHTYMKARNATSPSTPFDWTVTPFTALCNIFDTNHNPQDILNYNNVRESAFSKAACDQLTTLVYYHDLPLWDPPDLILPVGNNADKYRADQVEKARSRHLHVFDNILSLRQFPHRIGFVRWQRLGHPESMMPNFFEGETLESLHSLISMFLKRENFSVLVVKTQFVPKGDPLPCEPFADFRSNEFGSETTLLERFGLDGEGDPADWRGDTTAWRLLLDKFTTTHDITIKPSDANAKLA